MKRRAAGGGGEAEERLWAHLRNRQLGGFKFRRQHPMGRFILDFYCAECRLVVEIDGGIHSTQQEADAVRTAYLESRGCRVLRFSNDQVTYDLEGVLAAIERVCTDQECKDEN